MLIERDTELPEVDRDRYNEFVAKLEMLGVTIRSLHADFMRENYDPVGGNISFEVAMECLREDDDGFFTAVGTVRVRAKAKKSRKVCKKIECTMDARYHVEDAFDDAMLAQFERNALFSLWPYLREAVHQASIKMEGPEFLLPLLRL